MQNNLDQYITSEISKQFHGSLAVVLDPKDADGIIKGINIGDSEPHQGHGPPGGSLRQDILWSSTGDDRNKMFLDLNHGGEEKIAAHLVKDLKKSMQPK